MKNQSNFIHCIAFIGLTLVSASLMAAESKQNTLLYISPNDYNYSVRLLHPYYDYWFEQGPIVEPIALKALTENDSDLTVCKANETADRIIRIKPSVFYNPQSRMYYGKLEATVLSGGGNVLGTYSGEAKQLGFVSVNHAINLHLNKVYTAAMSDLMTKLNTHKEMSQNGSEAKLPCGIVGAQAEPRINYY